MTEATEKITFSPEQIAEVFGGEPSAPAEAAVQEAKPSPSPEEKPAPDTKVAERIAAATRAERKAEQRRLELESRAKEIEARDAEIKLFEQDPTAFIAKKGWGQKEIATFLEKLAGQHTPEAEADRKLSANEQRLKELEEKLAAKEAAEQDAAQAAQIQAAEKSAAEAFIADVTANAEKYPHLTQEFSESEAAQQALLGLRAVVRRDADGTPVTRVQAFIAKHGRAPTHDEIAEYLDGIAKTRIEARASASWGRKDKAANEGSKPTLGQQDSTPPVKGSSPRTLSRADTSQRAAAPITEAWSQAKADEESLRIFERAMRKG